MLVAPLTHFDVIDRDQLNRALVAWEHSMGPWHRPYKDWAHGMWINGQLVGVTATGTLIRETCAGLTRDEAVELGRVCAAAPDICRMLVRWWRLTVFPALCREHGYAWALSYQDSVLHRGDLYRFDGWVPLATSRSGTDQRSGRRGRSKIIWGWHPDRAVREARKMPPIERAA